MVVRRVPNRYYTLKLLNYMYSSTILYTLNTSTQTATYCTFAPVARGAKVQQLCFPRSSAAHESSENTIEKVVIAMTTFYAVASQIQIQSWDLDVRILQYCN